MNWFQEAANNTNFKYVFEDGSSILGTLTQLSGLAGQTIKGLPGEAIEIDGLKATYAGFEPIKIGQKSEVFYEKNGRKAVAIRDRDGTMKYISETKRHYKKTGEVKQQFSRALETEIEKSVQRELQAAQFTKKTKPYDPMAEAIKKLGDGEYVSDGKSFIRADEYEEEIKSAKPKEQTC